MTTPRDTPNPVYIAVSASGASCNFATLDEALVYHAKYGGEVFVQLKIKGE